MTLEKLNDLELVVELSTAFGRVGRYEPKLDDEYSIEDIQREILRRLNSAPRWHRFDDKDNPPPMTRALVYNMELDNFMVVNDVADLPRGLKGHCLYQILTPPPEATNGIQSK